MVRFCVAGQNARIKIIFQQLLFQTNFPKALFFFKQFYCDSLRYKIQSAFWRTVYVTNFYSIKLLLCGKLLLYFIIFGLDSSGSS
jgi:hypothetical protein